MPKCDIDENLFKALFAETAEEFAEGLSLYFKAAHIDDFTVWSITGNICEPFRYTSEKSGSFDIFELGYSDTPISVVNKEVSYFESSFFITVSLFLGYQKRHVFAVTFHRDIHQDVYKELEKYAPYLGKRAFDLSAAEKRMDLYIDYQKKVDFVKKAGIIFKALDIESVISISLSFFMEVFSAEAVLALHRGSFKGIGVDEKDMEKSIFIGNLSLKDYLAGNKRTAFIETSIISKKFNIKNIFFVYEENSDILIAMFNIITDIIPDKEFSSLVAGIVSIAAENALNHEKMTRFKVEETEIANTINILNKFVQREISIPSVFDINAATYPARNAGGDFIDLRKEGDKIVCCLADVCGKGYSAAVFTVVLSVFMDNLSKFASLGDALKAMNKFLLDKNFENRFITLFACVIDEKQKTLDYISCGHDPAFIMGGGETVILKSRYLPMGLAEENYEAVRTTIPDEPLLFIYTDGLIEYTDFDGLVRLVKEYSDLKSLEIINALYGRLVTDKLLQRDDFTCIVLKDK